jgi:hypothetical protein
VELKSVEVFSEASNYGIVRMPGRAYPGCVVQGDTLASLCRTARRVLRLALQAGEGELADEAEMLVEQLEDRLRHYESVLTQHSIPFPYSKPQ